MKLRRTAQVCLLSAFILLFTGIGVGSPIRIGYSALSGVFTPLWLAQDEGYFKRHGLETETVYISGGAVVVQALLAGDLQFAVAGAAGPMRAAASGADLKLIASTMNAMDFHLVARPEIAALEALRGKKIGVTRLGGDTDLALHMLLQKAGLQRGRDLTVLQTGGMPQMMATLRAGALDAGVITAMLGFAAAKSGFRRLVDFSDIDFPYPFGSVVARDAYIQRQRDVALRFLRAYAEAMQRAVSDREAAMKALAKATRVQDVGVLGAAYRHYRARYQKKIYVDAEGVKNVVRFEFKDGDVSFAANVVDNSLVAELEREGRFRER